MKKIYIGLITVLFGMYVLPALGGTTALAADYDAFKKACDNLSAAERAKSAACSSNKEVKECTDAEQAKQDRGDNKANPLKCNPVAGSQDSILYRITRMVTAIAGAIAVIIIIVGGISMMTSGGDSQKFANGRNTLIFAAIGLVLIVVAQALITFTINKFT